MKALSAIPALLIAALMMATLLPMASAPAAAEKVDESMLIDIRLDGPDAVGTNLTEAFTLRVSYPYEQRIENFSYAASVVAKGNPGGLIAPDNGTADSGVFEVEIKGAWKAGTMTVKINATAKDVSGTTWYRVKEFDITVVDPVFVVGSMVNRGYADVTNITVKMVVDGDVMRTELYNMTSGQTIELNFSWIFSSMAEGRHIIKLIVNDPLDTVEFSTGDNVLTFEVYYSDSGNILRGTLVIMIVFVAIILVLTYLQKRPSAKAK